MNFIERIEKVGLKHSKIASELGVSRVFLSGILNGKREMPEDRRNQIDRIIKKYEQLQKPA